jgi:hypothetical protein
VLLVQEQKQKEELELLQWGKRCYMAFTFNFDFVCFVFYISILLGDLLKNLMGICILLEQQVL